jgi:hypothetical protein
LYVVILKIVSKFLNSGWKSSPPIVPRSSLSEKRKKLFWWTPSVCWAFLTFQSFHFLFIYTCTIYILFRANGTNIFNTMLSQRKIIVNWERYENRGSVLKKSPFKILQKTSRASMFPTSNVHWLFTLRGVLKWAYFFESGSSWNWTLHFTLIRIVHRNNTKNKHFCVRFFKNDWKNNVNIF